MICVFFGLIGVVWQKTCNTRLSSDDCRPDGIVMKSFNMIFGNLLYWCFQVSSQQQKLESTSDDQQALLVYQEGENNQRVILYLYGGKC